MAYPMGLPVWDSVRMLLDDAQWMDATAGTQASAGLMDPETAELWMAGKDFQRGQLVGDRVGRNEKTKVICKLQQSGAGAPAREPAVSEDEWKAMMAHYFKRQEEMKKLAEANDDDYLASTWADPSALKNGMRGTSQVRMPGMR